MPETDRKTAIPAAFNPTWDIDKINRACLPIPTVVIAPAMTRDEVARDCRLIYIAPYSLAVH